MEITVYLYAKTSSPPSHRFLIGTKSLFYIRIEKYFSLNKTSPLHTVLNEREREREKEKERETQNIKIIH